MKKIYMLLLTLTLVFALCACSKDEPAKNTDNKTTDTPSATNIKTTVTPTDEVTPEPTSDPSKADVTSPIITEVPEVTDEVTPEPTEEVTPEPTEEVTPEPTEEPAQGINPMLLTEEDLNDEKIYTANINYAALEASLREFCETRYNDPEKEYAPMACLGEEYGLSSGRTLQDEWNDYGFDSPFIFLDLFQTKTIDYKKFNQIDFESKNRTKTMRNARSFFNSEFNDCTLDYEDVITNKSILTSISLFYMTKIDLTSAKDLFSIYSEDELFNNDGQLKNIIAYRNIFSTLTTYGSLYYYDITSDINIFIEYYDEYKHIDTTNICIDYLINYLALNPDMSYVDRGLDSSYHYGEVKLFNCIFGPYYEEILTDFMKSAK